MKIAVVTDSTAYLTTEQYNDNQIYRLPLSVIVNGEALKEEIDVTNETYFDLMRQSEKLPTSSQPTLGDIEELFTELSTDYDAINQSGKLQNLEREIINKRNDLEVRNQKNIRLFLVIISTILIILLIVL